MYRDISLKSKYYLEESLKTLRKNNSSVNMDDAKGISRLINKYLSIFRYKNTQNNDFFDVDKLKNDTEKILSDLKILYSVVMAANDDLINIKHYINCHIEELENYVDKYEDRIQLELNNTTLGDTLYYQDSDFSFLDDGTSSYLSLGTVSIANGSKLSCFYESKNNPSNITFTLYQNNLPVYMCEPYSINGEILYISGELKKKYYAVILDDDLIVNTSFMIMPESLKYDAANTYYIYGGKNKIKTISSLITKIIDKNPTCAVLFEEDTEVEFYIVGGSTAQLDFSKEPTQKNFNAYTFSFSGTKKISFKVSAGTAFHIITDGTIYSEKKIPTKYNDALYYPEESNLKDFLIEEIASSHVQDYLIIVKLLNELKPVTPKYLSIKVLDRLVDDKDD